MPDNWDYFWAGRALADPAFWRLLRWLGSVAAAIAVVALIIWGFSAIGDAQESSKREKQQKDQTIALEAEAEATFETLAAQLPRDVQFDYAGVRFGHVEAVRNEDGLYVSIEGTYTGDDTPSSLISGTQITLYDCDTDTAVRPGVVPGEAVEQDGAYTYPLTLYVPIPPLELNRQYRFDWLPYPSCNDPLLLTT
ncbi:MAG TPA: hypothetical protein DCQ04_15875 [Actinobacteria bacterium]|nr:hypothetical protein [Actinomycetota bacterium]